ncbi:MAG: hypothetical protein SFY56_11335 [Bacteroidota bacterium]|nr:hypothetical protein [Bacteroidota bacterium]
MKKSLLILSTAAILFSCKKDKTAGDFTQTDVTGTAIVKGNVSKNVVIPNGGSGWNTNGRVNLAGVTVTIKVNKSSLYPGSQAVGADVYSGTTDANGNYAISVKTNATGVSALLTIDGFNATLDTLINGVTKPGLYGTYTGLQTTIGSLQIGANQVVNHNFTASNLTSNPQTIAIGSAVVTGSVGMQFVLKSRATPTSAAVFGTTVVPVPAGTKVYLDFDKDPTTLATKRYETTVDASGNYTFNLATVSSTATSFNQDASLWVADFSRTRDTVLVVGTGTAAISGGANITGKAGVYNNTTNFTSGVYTSEIRNAINLSYTSFTAN